MLAAASELARYDDDLLRLETAWSKALHPKRGWKSWTKKSASRRKKDILTQNKKKKKCGRKDLSRRQRRVAESLETHTEERELRTETQKSSRQKVRKPHEEGRGLSKKLKAQGGRDLGVHHVEIRP